MQLFTNYFGATRVTGGMSAEFKFVVFLSHDAMLAWYMPSPRVRLCGVDVAFRWLSEWTRLQWAASTCSGRVHSLPRG